MLCISAKVASTARTIEGSSWKLTSSGADKKSAENAGEAENSVDVNQHLPNAARFEHTSSAAECSIADESVCAKASIADSGSNHATK